MKGRITLLASIVALVSSGCVATKKKLVLPAVPQVAEAKPLPEAKIENPPEIETPVPMFEIPLPEMPAEPEIENPPPKPVPKRRPQPAPTPAVQTPPPEVPVPIPIVPPAPTPRLGGILTDDRRREYEAEFTGYVTLARAAVSRASASGRRLNATQRERVVQIRGFLQQAETWKAKDLATALQLARRADLLGQDLLKSLP